MSKTQPDHANVRAQKAPMPCRSWVACTACKAETARTTSTMQRPFAKSPRARACALCPSRPPLSKAGCTLMQGWHLRRDKSTLGNDQRRSPSSALWGWHRRVRRGQSERPTVEQLALTNFDLCSNTCRASSGDCPRVTLAFSLWQNQNQNQNQNRGANSRRFRSATLEKS